MPVINKLDHYLQISRNLFFVLRGIWVLIIFHLIAILAFLFLPQGADILLLLLENSFQVGNPAALLFLLMGVCFWSMSSEFCCRMLLYMTDNSGHALSVASVKSRKALQVGLAKYCLYIPPFILAIGLIKAYFQNQSDNHFPLGVLIMLLLVLAVLCWLFFQLYHAKRKYKIFRKWMRLSAQEAYWTGKLYGIFNQYRIDLPQELHLATHTSFEIADQNNHDLPRETPLTNGSFIPVEFVLVEHGTYHQPYPTQTWVYQIPLSFYSCLLKQFYLLCFISLFLIIVFTIIPLNAYAIIGAAALVCFSFGCWQLVYAFLHFLDRAQPIASIKIPYRFLVLIWLLFCSFFNQDHPIRILKKVGAELRPTVQAHFESWAKHVERKTTKDSIPIYLVTAEGGALRTGAFTALVLSKLTDLDSNFSKRIYAYSTVSGGSLGAGFFQSIQGIKNKLPDHTLSLASKQFFEMDFLSAVTGKLVFAEIVQYLIPWHCPNLDRAIALEKSWEAGWANTILNNKSNPLEQPISVSENDPAILFQTVEVETGLPCIWSNLNLQGAIALSSNRDLATGYKKNIALSTAILLSARFPLLSPAAMFENQIGNNKIRRHYVDGGYFDNSGQETMLQLIQSLPFEKHPRLIPRLLCFNFSETDSSWNKGIRFGNEITEIITGIYQTRNARTTLANQALHQYCLERFGQGHLLQIGLSINSKELPMNWVLSHTAMQRVDSYCNSLIQEIVPFISLKNHPL
jgi:hypothetical protein